MFKFLDMIDQPYEDRMVGRLDDENLQLSVSTIKVTDSRKPYETAVASPSFRGGKWVIVGTYNSREEAQEGHDKWVKVMTAEILPEKLIDVGESETALMCSDLGDPERVYVHN